MGARATCALAGGEGFPRICGWRVYASSPVRRELSAGNAFVGATFARARPYFLRPNRRPGRRVSPLQTRNPQRGRPVSCVETSDHPLVGGLSHFEAHVRAFEAHDRRRVGDQSYFETCDRPLRGGVSYFETCDRPLRGGVSYFETCDLHHEPDASYLEACVRRNAQSLAHPRARDRRCGRQVSYFEAGDRLSLRPVAHFAGPDLDRMLAEVTDRRAKPAFMVCDVTGMLAEAHCKRPEKDKGMQRRESAPCMYDMRPSELSLGPRRGDTPLDGSAPFGRQSDTSSLRSSSRHGRGDTPARRWSSRAHDLSSEC
jgi:hypothetical protein